MRLYEYPETLRSLVAMTMEALDENEHDLVEDIAAEIRDLYDDFDEQAEAISRVYRDLGGEADKVQAEADRLRDIARTLRNRADRLKSYLHDVMLELDVDRCGSKGHGARLQKSPPSVEFADDFDVNVLPSPMRRVTVTPDKRAILDALAQGEEVPGVRRVQKRHLRWF